MKHWKQRGVLSFAALVAGILTASGCGSPGAPQAPSLNLPEKVINLTAQRGGNIVILRWTMPSRSTDHLLLKGPLAVRLCRRPADGVCQTIADLNFDPGVDADFRETLPADLTIGPARLLTYVAEVRNRRGRSAGFSNEAYSSAGQAPPPLLGITAQPQSTGVLFHWQPNKDDAHSRLRLHRTLIANAGTSKPKSLLPGSKLDSKEPAETELIAKSSKTGQALDASALPGHLYSYTAERLNSLILDGNPVTLAGPQTAPFRVDTRDVFPPSSPEGLVAIANRAEHSLDLSWTPNTEPDLAGYFVYRQDANGQWRRVSGDKPLPGPAWRDLTPPNITVLQYSVSAVDFSGNESLHCEPITARLLPN